MKDIFFAKKKQTRLKKAALIVFFLTSQMAPATAEVLTTENIEGIEVEIRRPANGVYPLIIFSHGMGACPAKYSGIQSRLANAGYIVVAPKHGDCMSGSAKPDMLGERQKSGQRKVVAIEETTCIWFSMPYLLAIMLSTSRPLSK